MELKGLKINFLGDSITEGHGTSSQSKRFSDLIADNYGAICRNYGIGGTRIARQKVKSACEAWDQDFISRVDHMEPEADLIVVFGGTNDFGHGDAPLGFMSDRTPFTFYGALHCLYISLIEKYPNSTVLVLTPLHRGNEENLKGDGFKEYNVGTLKKYVDIIREVAEFYSLPVLDLYAQSGLQPNIPIIKEKFVPDALHPNDAGHIILASKIANFIKTI